LAVANVGSNDLTILLGNGDGNFIVGSPVTLAGRPESIAVGDFNKDGKLDLAVPNALLSNNISILSGKGDGSFILIGSPIPAGPDPSIVVEDFNKDGDLDLAVVNPRSHDLSIWRGKGDGSFTLSGLPISVPPRSKPMIADDFNNDGEPDLAIADTFSGTFIILLSDGSGGFTRLSTTIGRDTLIFAIASGDFNKDGDVDLVLTDGPGTYYHVTILLGDGQGGFTEPVSSPIPAGKTPVWVAVRDFNKDGYLDLAAANYNSNNVTILLGDGSGFREPTGSTIPVGDTPGIVTTADFNLDGNPDIVTANYESNNLTILLGDGKGGFTEPPGSPVSLQGNRPLFLAVADFDLDGRPDIAVTVIGPFQPRLFTGILLGNGGGRFDPPSFRVSSSVPTYYLVAGDFNLDGKPDLAVHGLDSSVHILLNAGAGNFKDSFRKDFPGSLLHSFAVADFNLDGIPDLAVAHHGAVTGFTILLGLGDGRFLEGTRFITSVYPPYSMVVGDFNLDGKPDMAFGINDFVDGDIVGITLGDGKGNFARPVLIKTTFPPLFIAISDFNLDGIPDLLAMAKYNPGIGGVLVGDGKGDFTQLVGVLVPVGQSPTSAAVADFNLDSKPDLAVADYYDNSVQVSLNTCNSTVTTLSARLQDKKKTVSATAHSNLPRRSAARLARSTRRLLPERPFRKFRPAP